MIVKQTATQWPINGNRGMVFSVQSVPRCYMQVSQSVEWSVLDGEGMS
jgi:hypothetical protein